MRAGLDRVCRRLWLHHLSLSLRHTHCRINLSLHSQASFSAFSRYGRLLGQNNLPPLVFLLFLCNFGSLRSPFDSLAVLMLSSSLHHFYISAYVTK
jgi:hypothetical protein